MVFFFTSPPHLDAELFLPDDNAVKDFLNFCFKWTTIPQTQDFCHDIQISLNRPIFLPRTDRESLGKDRADKQEGDKVQPFLWPVIQNESISLLSKLSAFPTINTISRLACSLPSDAPEIYLG